MGGISGEKVSSGVAVEIGEEDYDPCEEDEMRKFNCGLGWSFEGDEERLDDG